MVSLPIQVWLCQVPSHTLSLHVTNSQSAGVSASEERRLRSFRTLVGGVCEAPAVSEADAEVSPRGVALFFTPFKVRQEDRRTAARAISEDVEEDREREGWWRDEAEK